METSAEVYEWTKEFLSTRNPLVYSCYHDHKQEIDLYNKPFEAKIDASKYFKNKGNELFKAGSYKKAASMYSKGLLQLDYTFPQSEIEIATVDKLKEDLNANCAMVAIKMESFQSALHHCDQVLYRKGISLLKLKRPSEAKTILTKALELEPNNDEIIKLLDKLNKI